MLKERRSLVSHRLSWGLGLHGLSREILVDRGGGIYSRPRLSQRRKRGVLLFSGDPAIARNLRALGGPLDGLIGVPRPSWLAYDGRLHTGREAHAESALAAREPHYSAQHFQRVR
jgi:hypothetical protein